MADLLSITLCFSPEPRQVLEMVLQVPAGSTLAQALALGVRQSRWPVAWTEQRCHTLSPGIWGRKAAWSTVLRENDRIELYRDLRVDPKVARRERFGKQGARRAGLFAKKRPGAAAGY